MKKIEFLKILSIPIFLSACGGESSAPNQVMNTDKELKLTETQKQTLIPITLSKVNIIQSHILPTEQGKVWKLKDGSELTYRATPNKSAIILLDLNLNGDQNPKIEIYKSQNLITSINLSQDYKSFSVDGNVKPLPFSKNTWIANIPKEYMQKGLRFRVISDNAQPSNFKEVEFSLHSNLKIQILPFYLFGASTNLIAYDKVISPTSQQKAELENIWPISELIFEQHPIGEIKWDYMIVPPSDGKEAEKVLEKDSRVINTILNTITTIYYASGNSSLNYQYYGPIVQMNSKGEYQYPGGGVGWGNVSVGDHYYSGIFNHESGHAFGLGHAAGEYKDNNFPYYGGSIKGSEWGFDISTNTFISDLVTSDAQNYSNCKKYTSHGYMRPLDENGNCYKVDVMESGSEDRSKKYQYGIFSDYNAARIQKYVESKTIINDKSLTNYSKWDQKNYQWIDYDPTDDKWDRARFGINKNYANKRNVLIKTVVFTISNANTKGMTQIYPVSKTYTGNLLTQIDPTDANDLAKISRNSDSIYKNFCAESGCDYTLKVYYKNQTTKHFAIQGGFRPWFKESDDFSDNKLDPKNSESFKTFAMNIPAENQISKVEILSTPILWKNGLDKSAKILASRDL